jgi:hypothetical protein
VAAAALLLTTACSGSSASSASNSDAGLGRIHSGVLHLRLEMSAGVPTARVGFTLDGPFDLTPAGQPLPVADLASSDLQAPTPAPDHFVSTGQSAFVVRDGVGYQLTADQTALLGATGTGSSASGTSLAGLDLGRWVVDPQSQPVTTRGDQQVDRITGRVDPVAALNDIVAMAGQFGSDQQTLHINDADADRVRSLVQSSSFELLTGHDDHLLRSVTATVEFAAPQSASSTTANEVLTKLAQLGRLTLTISLQIDGPNGPVTVTPPSTVRPISELPSR